MKRLAVILIILLPAAVYSQRFSGGIVAGFNASQIDGDFWYGYNKAGLMGGAFVFTDFKDKWRGQMEIRYSAKGSSTVRNDTAFIRKYVLRYIEIPLILEYRLFKKVQLQAGASIGYMFYAGQSDGYNYQKLSRIKPTETAICVGLNASYFDPINLNIRFSYSIFPVYDYYTGQSYGTGAWYNNVITFGIYYRIGKKRI